ncbi:cytochrome c oxidase assembly protein [Microbacterium sp. NPDC058345]|uniref:cytochrome c oxidase assembly protein n=1 Tax=Microbacterium sp. NPDC058345 TaxID=3346455 RepID=UPI003651D5BF
MAPAHVHGLSAGAGSIQWVFALPYLLAVGGYLAAMSIDRRRGRRWPPARCVNWVAGCTAALVGVMAPLVVPGASLFVGHMAAHLLVGMLAPLLLVLGAPISLALRTLDVVPARRLSRILRSAPVRLLTIPAVAAALNVGSLAALYLTPLHSLAQVPLYHLVLMGHFLIVGCLFTAAIVPVDPSPHRSSIRIRVVVLVLTLAAHAVLAKLIYAYPPSGVGVGEAETAAQLMYYGGDAVDLVLLFLLFAQWYRATGRRFLRPSISTPAEKA